MKINGKDLLVFVENAKGLLSALAFSTQCELDVTREVTETAGFDTGRWREYVPGRAGWTVAVACLLSEETENGYDLQALMESDSPLRLSFSTTDPAEPGGRPASGAYPKGIIRRDGQAYLTRLTYTGQLGSMASWQAEFQGTGTLASYKPVNGLENSDLIENRETILMNEYPY